MSKKVMWKIHYKYEGGESWFECKTQKAFTLITNHLFRRSMPSRKDSTVEIKRVL